MLKLLKQEDVAILLVSELVSSPNQLIPLAKIGKMHGISLFFLKKLARNLKNAGLITSREGVKGGYTLARDPKAISVLDIMEAIEEKNQWSKVERKGDCPLATCLPQKIRKTLVYRIEKSLRSISLWDITNL